MGDSLSRAALAMLAGIILTGCAAPTTQEVRPSDCTPHVAQALRDREAELAAARAEAATSKIAAAKQAAELQELRSVVPQLRQDNAESHRALMVLRQEIAARQEEAERLRVEQEQAEQVKQAQQLWELQRTVAALTQELEGLKQDVQQTVKRAVTSSADPGRSTAATGNRGNLRAQLLPPVPTLAPTENRNRVSTVGFEPPGNSREGEVMRQVTVQPGDTLWHLALRYGLSVQQLREANGLQGDIVRSGQRLNIPASESQP